MKTVFLISAIVSALAITSFPYQDDFDSFGGANEWSFYGNTASSGSHSGHLCFNAIAGSTLQRNSVYGAMSQDYATLFADSLCDDITITFDVSMWIRNQDVLNFFFYDYVMATWYYATIPSSGTWTMTIPSTTSQFAIQLSTGGGGGLNGRYIHVDYFRIECNKNVIFDADLLNVDCSTFEDHVEVIADFSDSTNIELEHSTDGIEWTKIGQANDTYIQYEHQTETTDNYYRVRFDDVKYSNTVYCQQDNIDLTEKEIKEVRYFNTLGQEITESDAMNQVHVVTKVYTDRSAKSEMKAHQHR